MGYGETVKKRRINIIYLVLFLIAAVLSVLQPHAFFFDGLSFYAFDVGQGDSILFHFPGGENVLIDAGTRKSAKSLFMKLKQLGVRKIDILVATHPHEDHIGGMKEVIGAFEIGKIWDSGYNHGSQMQREMLEEIKRRKIRFGRPRAGFIERIGDAEIEVIAPKRQISGTNSDANNNSLILKITYGRISFLMMGDVEERGRDSAGSFPRSVVLKASHHGSRNGTDEKLLSEVKPEVAILSYGRGNPYGHPHKEVLKLFRDHRVKVYATVSGDIIMTTDGKSYSVKTDKKR